MFFLTCKFGTYFLRSVSLLSRQIINFLFLLLHNGVSIFGSFLLILFLFLYNFLHTKNPIKKPTNQTVK